MKWLKQERILLLLVALMYCFHWFSKDISDPYQRPIVGDAQGYWAYLPAIFIYQDLEYNFFEEAAQPYYPEGHLKDFKKITEDGEIVNKTFPGVGVLYSPFFFLGHATAYLTGYPTDGFSGPYQFWFDIGLWFYFLLGLIFLKRFLEGLGFTTSIALSSAVIIALGTNIFFYTVYDQSVTHIYNFCLINGFLLSLLQFKKEPQHKWLIIAIVLLALIGISRPTNAMVLLLLPIFFTAADFYQSIFSRIFSRSIWKYVLSALPILALPFILWKLQTGNWVVYSYGEEGFDFSDPHFFDFLISYTKGWWTYTPIALLILIIGLPVLLKQKPSKAILIFFFYLITIYVFSSWWCWYYGAGMSQRVMIDHYILLAFVLAIILRFLAQRKFLLRMFMAFMALLTVLNISQAYQIKNGIIQFGSATEEQYWDVFLEFTPQARIYPKDHWQFVEMINVFSKDESKGILVNAQQVYSPVLKGKSSGLDSASRLILSFEAMAQTEVKQSRAVLRLTDINGNEQAFPFFFSEFVKMNDWVQMEFLFEPTQEFQPLIQLFFWNGDTEESIEFRKVYLKHYRTNAYM